MQKKIKASYISGLTGFENSKSNKNETDVIWIIKEIEKINKNK